MKRKISFLLTILLTTILTACLSTTNSFTPTDTPVENPSDGSPPPATLEIDGTTQTAGVGTFCWNAQTANNESVDMCVDKIGLPAPYIPLISKSPVTARLILPLADSPNQLGLSIFQATAENEVKVDAGTDKFRYWMPAEGINCELKLQTTQEITLELDSGLYVFYVFAVWGGKGDASYGFLVEVQ